MRKGTAALGLVALIALGVGLSAVLADGGNTLTVTLRQNGNDDAGCLAGEMSIEVGDFGEVVQDGDTWRGSKNVILTIPLSQDEIPQAIDCRIELVASDLSIAVGSDSIPGGHLAIVGCDLATPVSLAGPRAMTCSVDTHTTHVEVVVSLVGLDRQPEGALSGTIVVTGTNGT